ncbi:MAG: copper homeostasis protein CutC [Streptococcaceae bacterium]|jgi:copper homeostasis protein|nr:copper homeostasis protein CutC [Streptococcaceae bacterium]
MLIREFCAENFTAVPQAVNAGVERIELCDNLSVGGTTPSFGVIQETADYLADTKTSFSVLIRPRGGNFLYDSHELKIMEIDILRAVEAGAHGLVFGCLSTDNKIDTEAMNTLLIASQGLPVTFHMAFDAIADADKRPALEALFDVGIDKVLLHGDSLDKPLNTEKIAALARLSKRPELMIGGGVTADNAQKLSALTETKFVHGTQIVTL